MGILEILGIYFLINAILTVVFYNTKFLDNEADKNIVNNEAMQSIITYELNRTLFKIAFVILMLAIGSPILLLGILKKATGGI